MWMIEGRRVRAVIQFNLKQHCWTKILRTLGFPVVQLVKNSPEMWETWVQSLVGKIPQRKERLPTLVSWPGEFHGLYSPWGHKESERLSDYFLF